MNHVPCRQPITLGDLGIAGLAAIQRPAFVQQLGAGDIVYRTIDAAPAKQRRVGRVDDGINAQRRDVVNDDFEPRLTDPAR